MTMPPAAYRPRARAPHLAGRLQRATTPIPTTLVAGPPCAGKTTWVRAHGRPGDLVVDLDALHAALTLADPAATHPRDAATTRYVYAARDAVLARLADADTPVRHAWLIATAPTRHDRYTHRLAYSADTVLILASPAVCHARAADERPPAWHEYIDAWHSAYEPDALDVVVHTDAGH